jgi:putative membrane protein
MENTSNEKKYNTLIILVSIVIPVVVALLFSIKLKDFGFDVKPLSFLPPIYATINGITAVLLVVAVKARLMKLAIACSVAFLVMYVAYHLTSESTKFGDSNHNGVLDPNELATVGGLRLLYFFILISHILLSVVIIPLVLFTYVRALAERFDRHKKLAKITFPIWISPYYAH